MRRRLGIAGGTVVAFTASAALAGGGPTIESATLKADEDLTALRSIQCPGSKRALGGGLVQRGGPNQLFMTVSAPARASGYPEDGEVATGWAAAVRNHNTRERTLKVLAICARRPKAVVEETTFTSFNNQVNEGYAVCPGNRRAVGGGVVPPGGSFGFTVHASGPLDDSGSTLGTDDGDVATQWYAAVESFTGTREVSVYAICAGNSNARIEATLFEVENGKTRAETARCKGSRRALGGGVVQSGSAAFLAVDASGPLDGSGGIPSDGDVPKQWYGAATDLSSGADRILKVFAICG